MTTMETEKFLTEIKEKEEYAIRVAQAKEKLDACELDEEMLDAVSGGYLHLLGGIAMIVASAITFYITVKVGIWVVSKVLG